MSSESVEDPTQIEAAVAYLIASPVSDNCSTPSPHKCNDTSENQDCTTKTDKDSYSHTPLHLKVKPLKRAITAPDYKAVSQKRRKSSQEKSSLTASPPYQCPKITEISVSTKKITFVEIFISEKLGVQTGSQTKVSHYSRECTDRCTIRHRVPIFQLTNF